MIILKLLSEEIFDFSKDQLTEQKTKTLKESLNHEFTQIFQVCCLLSCMTRIAIATHIHVCFA